MARFVLRNSVSREKLENLYLGQELSSNDIGRYFDVSGATIVKLLDEYGIARRGPGGGRLRHEHGRNQSS